MFKTLPIVVILCLICSPALASRDWPAKIEVKKISLSTADYANTRRCLSFSDQNGVVYYYDHNDDPIRLENAQTMLSILMFAKATSNTVSMITDDAPEGSCGARIIRTLSAE